MAYILATIQSNELLNEGDTRLMVEFTGDAGETARKRPFIVTGATTALQLRQWVTTQLADLNAGRSVSTLAGLQAGQTITPAALPTPPVPTAEDTWWVKADRLRRARALGLTNATALGDITALEIDVNTTYQAGYVGNL